ncbi:molybdopterin cofactor-binding domain-containing protein [Roseateles chitinivorans]|uniref:xanthine dehydrogenase family protein molybdopterin-binding subunit n=1 Tax=Roseateles chitinivorans TaxID=2917965 RepID=UPI003D664504
MSAANTQAAATADATATGATGATGATRRHFLKATGLAAGGLALEFTLPMSSAVAQAQAQTSTPGVAPTGAAPAGEVTAWLLIHPDESVIIRIARAEMGQGTLTGLAQLVAEELECNWANVRFELVKPGANRARARVWRDMGTGGSRGIRGSQDYVRKAGAAARAMLVSAAAQQWAVPVAECTVDSGTIRHAASKRQTTFGAVAAAANKLPIPEDVVLKDPSQWRIAGKPLKRLDTADKLNGSLVYGMDLRLPGMIVALPKACPVHGGTLVSFDKQAVLKMPGVRDVIKVDDATIAVLADRFWQAKRALDALPVVWDKGPNASVSSASIAAMISEGLQGDTPFVGNRQGDAKAQLQGASRVIEADYGTPFQNHAPMEPLSATVQWTAQRCDVWAPTQVAEAALATVADAAGLDITACEVHPMRIGGSFGRRLATDYLAMAVRIAKQRPGVPVKMMWTREEDMLQGRFHPVTQCRLRATLDGQGRIGALHMRIAGQSITSFVNPKAITANGDATVFQGLLADSPEGHFGYEVPHLLIDHAMRNPHVRPGYWRGVNTNQNAIYSECFIDELAHAAGKDPFEFRKLHMAKRPKHLAVLQAVADRAGWSKPAPKGVFRGIAQYMGFGSYTAAVAEVSVKDGQLKVLRIVAATDPGHVVNPQQVEAQVAGSFVYGLGAALFGGNTVKDGAIAETNFDTYGVLRLYDMPAVEVIVMPSGGFWGGVGEPTIAVAAPAVLNAVFAATGKRIRQLPLKDNDLSKA